jgi:hypothetical protein
MVWPHDYIWGISHNITVSAKKLTHWYDIGAVTADGFGIILIGVEDLTAPVACGVFWVLLARPRARSRKALLELVKVSKAS